MNPKEREQSFETEPWSRTRHAAPARNLTVTVTRDHVERAYWTKFMDPVSLAMKEALNEHACAETFWNSDGFQPRYPGDAARLGIHLESLEPETGRMQEKSYWIPLPRRAASAMRKLSREGIVSFQEFRMRIWAPAQALR